MMCRYSSKECYDCGICEREPVLYDRDGEPIFDGERYYDIDGEIIAYDTESLKEWAKNYIRRAER